MLPDGRVMTTAGIVNAKLATNMAEVPEVYSGILNGWAYLGSAPNDMPSNGGNMYQWYPHMFVLPGSAGTYVLHAGPQRTVNGVPPNHVQRLGDLQLATPSWANIGSTHNEDGGAVGRAERQLHSVAAGWHVASD
jgi:hypothetical protein